LRCRHCFFNQRIKKRKKNGMCLVAPCNKKHRRDSLFGYWERTNDVAYNELKTCTSHF
jgi:hypothetical protein